MSDSGPYFEKTATGTSLYVRHWLDEYSNEPSKKTMVSEKLSVIFSKESEYRTLVLKENNFVAIFREKIRRKRLEYLKMFLMEIDPDRYSGVNFDNWK
ncbi:MAG: hypothetical protein LBI14_00285 [Treponema sp.]|jgi:hypothetical protein|nr:hypothetical protein [Treponema sp.]